MIESPQQFQLTLKFSTLEFSTGENSVLSSCSARKTPQLVTLLHQEHFLTDWMTKQAFLTV